MRPFLRNLVRSVTALLATTLLGGALHAQSGGVLTADKAVIPHGDGTPVLFTLALPSSPTLISTSPTLQRQGANGWSVIGRLYDDGTHGDATAGDSVFSLQVTLNEQSVSTISFRGSTAYRGVIRRSFSNMLDLSVTQALALTVSSGSDEIFITEGSTKNVLTTFSLTNSEANSVQVTNTMTITPTAGVSVVSDYPSGGWSSSGTQTFVVNQRFTGLTVGEYVVTNTGTIVGQGVTSSDSVIIHVIPVGGNPEILPVGAYPAGIQTGVATSVLFTATIASFIEAPAALDLRLSDGNLDPVVTQLRDDGNNGDLQADDGVYSGRLTVTAQEEGTIQYFATALFPGVPEEVSSAPFLLIAGCHPMTVAASDMGKVILDPNSGLEVVSNELLVAFESPKTCAELNTFNGQFGTQIVGSIPGLNMYQLVFDNPNNSASVLNNKLDAIANHAWVSEVAPNVVGSITEMVPNDPMYSSQYAPQKIRADEAWVIARGGAVIAVLDTGVDYNHEDLTGKVILGPDLVNGDADPMDDQGHGTHVAGIAAAYGNNGKGIAGLAWDSPILAVKMANSAGSITYAHAAESIKTAADLGAKVINCSWGFKPSLSSKFMTWWYGLEDAVNYATAKGAVVVVAAGNEGNNRIRIPGNYASSYCVGSTTSSDTRSSFSCFGPEVDIAAPGSSILSTLMGGSYGNKSGTSMATPAVSGAIAVLWSRFPAYTPAQLRARIGNTAVPLPGAQLGAGRVDLFEAVFNGSFEDSINEWTVTGTGGAVPNLGPLTPTDRDNLGFASSGPDSLVTATSLSQSFTVQPGVTQFKISFDYNFVTEEYPEWVGRGYNDNVRITLVKPDGGTEVLAFEDVDSSAFSSVGGINFPGGDSTTGQTGWKSVSKTIPVTTGPGQYSIVVRDEGDGIYDSNVLIDKIRFK